MQFSARQAALSVLVRLWHSPPIILLLTRSILAQSRLKSNNAFASIHAESEGIETLCTTNKEGY